MNSDLIGVIFTGIIGILTAIGGLQFQRGRRTEKAQIDLVAEFKVMKKELSWLRKRDIASEQHMYALERTMAAAGFQIPNRPAILLEDTSSLPMVKIESSEESAE